METGTKMKCEVFCLILVLNYENPESESGKLPGCFFFFLDLNLFELYD